MIVFWSLCSPANAASRGVMKKAFFVLRMCGTQQPRAVLYELATAHIVVPLLFLIAHQYLWHSIEGACIRRPALRDCRHIIPGHAQGAVRIKIPGILDRINHVLIWLLRAGSALSAKAAGTAQTGQTRSLTPCCFGAALMLQSKEQYRVGNSTVL